MVFKYKLVFESNNCNTSWHLALYSITVAGLWEIQYVIRRY